MFTHKKLEEQTQTFLGFSLLSFASEGFFFSGGESKALLARNPSVTPEQWRELARVLSSREKNIHSKQETKGLKKKKKPLPTSLPSTNHTVAACKQPDHEATTSTALCISTAASTHTPSWISFYHPSCSATFFFVCVFFIAPVFISVTWMDLKGERWLTNPTSCCLLIYRSADRILVPFVCSLVIKVIFLPFGLFFFSFRVFLEEKKLSSNPQGCRW